MSRMIIGRTITIADAQKYFLLFALVILLLVPRDARAEIQPSFDLEHFSWKATDIVVVSEGERIDGEVVVVESWKGTLAEGDRITVPPLAHFAPEQRRIVSREWQG